MARSDRTWRSVGHLRRQKGWVKSIEAVSNRSSEEQGAKTLTVKVVGDKWLINGEGPSAVPNQPPIGQQEQARLLSPLGHRTLRATGLKVWSYRAIGRHMTFIWLDCEFGRTWRGAGHSPAKKEWVKSIELISHWSSEQDRMRSLRLRWQEITGLPLSPTNHP